MLLGVFAIIFGARKLDSSERHEGLIFAIAFESIIKLAAFVMVGIFVTYGLFNGFIDIFEKIKESDYGTLLYLGTGTSVSYQEWAALLFLSMMAIMFLPRQFHVAVVENNNESEIKRAIWLYPVYLVLINLFVVPIALAGLLTFQSGSVDSDMFVLALPLESGSSLFTIVAFVGGLSAATAMVIVESVALSIMVSNDLVMPLVLQRREALISGRENIGSLLLTVRRIAIFAILLLAYVY